MKDTPQVSIWIPLLVAGIGFIGVLASQVLSAWQETRRARRAQADKAADRAHEDHSWHRGQRLALYGEFVTTVAQVERDRDEIGRHSIAPGDPTESREALKMLRESCDHMRHAGGQLQVLATLPIVNYAMQIELNATRCYTAFMGAVIETVSVDKWEETHDDLKEQFIITRDKLLNAMREDLGTPER